MLPVLLLISGCEKKDTVCPEEAKQLISNTDFIVDGENFCTLKNIDDSQKEVNLLIQDQADYEKYVDCVKSHPSVNFTVQTLLVGRLKAPHGDFIVSQNVTFNCNEKYSLNVEIAEGPSAVPTDVYYYAVIPKVSSSAQVVFNVQYVQ